MLVLGEPRSIARYRWNWMYLKKVIKQIVTCYFLLYAMAAFAQTDPAQHYPNRSIRVAAPYPAGGTSDILIRLIGQKLAEK